MHPYAERFPLPGYYTAVNSQYCEDWSSFIFCVSLIYICIAYWLLPFFVHDSFTQCCHAHFGGKVGGFSKKYLNDILHGSLGMAGTPKTNIFSHFEKNITWLYQFNGEIINMILPIKACINFHTWQVFDTFCRYCPLLPHKLIFKQLSNLFCLDLKISQLPFQFFNIE